MDAEPADGNFEQQPVLVVISGNLLDIGRILSVGLSTKIVGRDPQVDFCLNDQQISRHHFRICGVEQTDGDYRIMIEDLNSTNGTIISGKPIKKEWIGLGETIAVGSETILLFRLERESKVQASTYPLRLIAKDPLTGVYNRRAFDQILTLEHEKSVSAQKPYCVLLIDIDQFKAINDDCGHPLGDRVLKSIATCMLGLMRSDDILARIGGDEFAILLPNQTIKGGSRLAERLRLGVSRIDFGSLKIDQNVTISIGLASVQSQEDNCYDIYRNADNALLKAKKQGRNRVIVEF